MNWQHADPAPALLVVPDAAVSLDEAHAAIELWEHYSRKTLDEAQRLVVEVLMAQRADGCWAAATTGRAMPRQNGKGDEIEVVELWGLVQRQEAILHTVHDAALLAGQAQARLLGVVESHQDLRRLVRKKWLGVGQQMVEFRGGGAIWYRTRTKGGGRGLDDVDRVVVDEAQLATVEHVGAVTPTLFANPNPQLNVLGSAGIGGHSAWWWSLRRRALSGDSSGFGFVEHTAERPVLVDGRVVSPTVDVTDRSLWADANPAIRAGRGSGMDFLDTQLTVMGPAVFGREHLGVWDPEAGEVGSFIPADVWVRACREPNHKPVGPLVYSLDVSPGAQSASIGVSDGEHIEVVMHGPGTAWVVDACEARSDQIGELYVDPAGPGGDLIVPLEAAGVEVRQMTTRESVQACGSFLTAVTDGTVLVPDHPYKDMLDRAVQGAAQRSVLDGGWLWSRKRSSVDISPLYAVTFARWAAGLAVEAPKPTYAF